MAQNSRRFLIALMAATVVAGALCLTSHRYCDNCDRCTAFGFLLTPTHCCIGTRAGMDLQSLSLWLEGFGETRREAMKRHENLMTALAKDASSTGTLKHIEIEKTPDGGWIARDTLWSDYPTHFAMGPDGKIHSAKHRPAKLDDPVIYGHSSKPHAAHPSFHQIIGNFSGVQDFR